MMVGVPKTIVTYIIVTQFEEYYVGKTNNIERRMQQHRDETGQSWFAISDRKNFKVKLIIDGDFEIPIKRFGVKRFMNAISNIKREEPRP